jgi:hypothetical protein
LSRQGITLPAVLPVLGIELDGRTVLATVTAASRFLGTNPGIDTASLLAQGVIRAMKLTRHLTILSAAVLAASLIGGVGWVSARSGSGEHAGPISVDDVKPTRSAQLAKNEGAIPPSMNDRAVRADQPEPGPEELEAIQTLKLDPVIGRSLKSNDADSPLRKLQKEVSQELGIYMGRMNQLMDIGKWNPQEFSEMIRVGTAFPKSLLELMEKPEDKMKCYELEVRLLEKFYKFTDARVTVGSDPSQNRNVAKAAWLEAKVKLLKLKMEMEKSKG